METRKASSVITRYMITKGELNLYVTMAYEVGKKAQVPGYAEFEKVLEIRVTDEWEPHVEVDIEN